VSSDSGGDQETGIREGKENFSYTAEVIAEERIVFDIEFEKESSGEAESQAKKTGPAVLKAAPEPNWTKGGGGIRNISGKVRITHRGEHRYWYKYYGLLGWNEEDWSTVCYGMYVGDK
jgi:hypothetical protein